MQRTQTQPSSTQRGATPTRTRRKSITSNQNTTPHSRPLLDTKLFWGRGHRRSGVGVGVGVVDGGIEVGSGSLSIAGVEE